MILSSNHWNLIDGRNERMNEMIRWLEKTKRNGLFLDVETSGKSIFFLNRYLFWIRLLIVRREERKKSKKKASTIEEKKTLSLNHWDLINEKGWLEGTS